MKQVITIMQVENKPKSRRVTYVHGVTKGVSDGTKTYGRYVTTTNWPKSAKRYESIEAANKAIESFKQLNCFVDWKAVIVEIESAKTQAPV